MESSSAAVEIDDVCKTFGSHRAVDHLSLRVPRGSIYGFIGPNGSGKSTTLRMIMRIIHPDQGEVRVLGSHQRDAANDRVGYLPEERGLYRKMKLREVLIFHAQLKGMRRPRPEIDQWLERFELTKWADKKVETLSKGMAQKAQFLATVIAKPELIVLDEPFSGLDPVNSSVLRATILELNRAGATIIFSTHDMRTAEKLCDYIFMIFQGKKTLDGTLSEIQAEYARDTIRVRMDAAKGTQPLVELDGVVQVNNLGQEQELRLAPDADSQKVLSQLMTRGRVQRFEVCTPSLEEIFGRITKQSGDSNSE